MFAKWMEKLKPETKKRIWISAACGLAAAFLMIIWIYKKDTFMIKPKQIHKTEISNVAIDGNSMMQKSTAAQLAAIQKVLDEETKRKAAAGNRLNPYSSARMAPNNQPAGSGKPGVISPIDQVITKKESPVGLQLQPTESRKPQSGLKKVTTPIPKQPSGEGKTPFHTPDPPGEGSHYSPGEIAAKAQPFKWSGEIAHSENPDYKKIAEKSDDLKKPDGDKKKEKRTVHLPVSFMKARTLNGLLVPATSDGKGDPYPLIVRVSTPAQLPNGIMSQLSACFVVTEAIGSLQQSRALVRVVSLTCLDKKGEALIETEVRGFVEDSDGKPGLAGIVAAPKFGKTVRYAAAAGFLSGIGDGMALTSATSTISAVGPIASYGTSAQDIGLAAAGKGISSATKKIADVYADLLHQSLPVVEVGNGKNITVWITKGVDIEIKNFKNIAWH